MENKRSVIVKLVFLTLSYKEKTPLFMLKDNKLPSNNFLAGQNLDVLIGQMLEEHLGIKYDATKGSENWVSPKLENVHSFKEDEVTLVFSCLIPDSYCEAGGEWKSIHDILNNSVEVDEDDKKILYDFAVGGK